MCEIQIPMPMKFKVDFKGEDYQSVFDSLVDNGLVSSFSSKYIVSRVLDEKCKDGVYYFTVTENKFVFGIYGLDRVSKDEYDNLDYNVYSYRQNQWIVHTDDSNEPRYCNGVKLPAPVDKIVHGKIYYYPTPTGYTKSGIIGFDVSMYEPDRITELLEANLLYEDIDDSDLHSDAMLLTHSTELVSNEPKEILIHENDLTEMKIKIKTDEEFMMLQQYFFNRGVGWLEFGGDKQFLDNVDTEIPIKYIYIVEEEEEFYMVTGYTDEVFESSAYPLGIFEVLKVIK